MNKWFFLCVLAVGLLLFPASRVFAEEQGGILKPRPEIQISDEDQKVIALMELLQKMDMLKDLDLMAVAEERK